MIIGVCGLGYTGSGAVVDLLKEYDGIKVEDKDEFGIVCRPDGLQDLTYHVIYPCRYMASDLSFFRFTKLYKYTFRSNANWGGDYSKDANKLLNAFIEDVVQVRWRGCWSSDSYLNNPIKNIIIGHFFTRISKFIYKTMGFLVYPNREMFLSINPDHFFERAQEFVSDTLSMLGYHPEDITVLNQPFSGDNPEVSFPFFVSPKAIVVDKDPRDLYFQCKYEVKSYCTWTPTYDVRKFVEYYKCLRQRIPYINLKNVLFVRFEDLIYEYEKTTQIIEQFVGLNSKQHKRKKQFLNIDVSSNNTQLFRKYSQEKQEIAFIEKNLSEYLYPYDRYPTKKQFGKSYND